MTIKQGIASIIFLIFIPCILFAQEQGNSYFDDIDTDPPPIIGQFGKFGVNPTSLFVVNRKNRDKMPFLFSIEFGPSVEYQKSCDITLLKSFQKKWIQDHPNALVIEVNRNIIFSGKTKKEVYVVLSDVWIIDGDKNFAIELARIGGCKSKVLLLKQELEGSVLVKKGFYKEFKSKLLEAEKLAIKDRLGVWKVSMEKSKQGQDQRSEITETVRHRRKPPERP